MTNEFTKGIFKENPIFIILLGLCPTLAVSTQVVNALGMGAGVIFVLLGSNIFISLLKGFIPLTAGEQRRRIGLQQLRIGRPLLQHIGIAVAQPR